ncbi:MAG: tetratricopeptide repeat protein [Methylomonas sp.]|jgi:tetratricopeptide (TPR) repeat protein
MNAQDPSFQEQSLFQQATTLHQSGRLTEAEALYKKILSTSSNKPQLLERLAIIAIQQGLHQKTLNYIDEFLKLQPAQPQLLFIQGEAYTGLGRVADAVDSYDKAIGLKSNYADAWLLRFTLFKGIRPTLYEVSQCTLTHAILGGTAT